MSDRCSAINFQIIKILGNLAYGVGGGIPHNKDVIRECGGVKKMLKCLSPKLSSGQVKVMMDAIAVLSWESMFFTGDTKFLTP